MRISKQGLDFIKSFEGLRLQSYCERGAEMLRHSTGVDAKALGRLLTVVCAKEREQIWRIKEEK